MTQLIIMDAWCVKKGLDAKEMYVSSDEEMKWKNHEICRGAHGTEVYDH